VIEDAHQRCYKPFLETLNAYPDFRFAAHFSGWLLTGCARHPDDMEMLAGMVRRGQVEMFSSGDTEPVLAAIPHRDRVGQLHRAQRQAGRVDRRTPPSGAWLTERVWESAVVPALAATGIRYVTVDDYHFFCTGRSADALDGHFSTEEDGTRLDLFPISEALRYRLPFHPPTRWWPTWSNWPTGPARRHLLRRHREIRHLA
jgi:alpha-amylase